MSENLIIVSSAEQARERYSLSYSAGDFESPAEYGQQSRGVKTPSIVSGGDLARVVTSKEPGTLQAMRFGFTPHRSETCWDLLNKRSDTVSKSDDDSEYDRLMSIFMKPDFCEPITAFRCVVLVDAFLVTSPDNSYYLIHMRNKERPFALAGIYDHWKDPATGEGSVGFTILTAAPNAMLRRIGVDQMPVILTQKNVLKWLDLKTDRRQYLPLIHTFPDNVMNGYPISGKVFSGQLTGQLLQPIGRILSPDPRG